MEAYARLSSAELAAVIVKSGDDLRQEQLVPSSSRPETICSRRLIHFSANDIVSLAQASQLLTHLKEIFENAMLPLFLYPYVLRCLPCCFSRR